MKLSRTCLTVAALFSATAFLLSSCSSKPALSTADVQKAFVAMTAGQDDASNSATFDPSSPNANGYSGTCSSSAGCTDMGSVPDSSGAGTITYSYTVTDLNTSAGTYSMNATLTFNNWYDASNGYVINGTMSIAISVAYTPSNASYFPETIQTTLTGNLTLNGGSVSTLGIAFQDDISIDSSGGTSATYSGSITANGTTYPMNQIA